MMQASTSVNQALQDHRIQEGCERHDESDTRHRSITKPGPAAMFPSQPLHRVPQLILIHWTDRRAIVVPDRLRPTCGLKSIQSGPVRAGGYTVLGRCNPTPGPPLSDLSRGANRRRV